MKQKLAFILILSLTSLLPVFAANPQYAIIVDAGSSGSRLHLFKYQIQTDSSLPAITDIFSSKVTPGLSSFVDSPQMAGESLKNLFDQATEQLQNQQVDLKTVPVSILATAGMRLLPPEKQKAIYDNISAYLQSHYSFTIKSIATISGTMEGVYDWLDVNYLAGNFQPNGHATGIIDMGGASTQIVYATNSVSENTVTFKLNGKDVTLFSKSFLGLGQDQARLSINTATNAASCYPQNFSVADVIKGDFNFASCRKLYADLIQSYHVVEQIPQVMNESFLAFSGVYFAYNFLRVDSTPDQATVEKSIQTVCSTSWEDLKQSYPKIPEKYLATYCANATYIDELLNNTYYVNPSKMLVAYQINGNDIDWPLGALLFTLLNPTDGKSYEKFS